MPVKDAAGRTGGSGDSHADPCAHAQQPRSVPSSRRPAIKTELLEAPVAPKRVQQLEHHGDVREDGYYWRVCRPALACCVGASWLLVPSRCAAVCHRLADARVSNAAALPMMCRLRDDDREDPDVIAHLKASGQPVLQPGKQAAFGVGSSSRAGSQPTRSFAFPAPSCRRRPPTPRRCWPTPRACKRLSI